MSQRRFEPDGIPEALTRTEIYKLAESLMGSLASLLDLYKTATYDHPDDDMRILTIGHMEAQVLNARSLLYTPSRQGILRDPQEGRSW